MVRDRNATRIYNANKFKLGLFGMNCSGGLSLTKAPERWDAAWDSNVAAAKMADEAGLEFLLPIGRWLGYRGEMDTQGTTFETLTWAAGLLATTRDITVFGTLHVAFVNPVFAAKQIVTADHIGHGRFGLNIVSGWNPGEFNMFGVALNSHEDRYAYSKEWLEIARRIWSENEPFDHDGRFFQLKGVLGKPRPFWDSRPVLVSAGNSPAGRSFAAQNADCLFTATGNLDELPGKIESFCKMAASAGVRNIFSAAHLMCRATRKEAQDYHHYIVHEYGDWEAAEYAANLRGKRTGTWMSGEADLRVRLMTGSSHPIVGSYDDAAEMFQKFQAMGIDGMAIDTINYLRDMPAIRDEILPRLERLGLREKTRR